MARKLVNVLTMIFCRVLYNENHVLHPLLPERNDHGYELRRRRHERGLFLRPTMPNAILYTNNCISGSKKSVRLLMSNDSAGVEVGQ